MNNRSIFLDKENKISKALQEYYEVNPYINKYYFGVTKALSHTKSEEDKASLQRWRDNVGEEEAERILQESIKIGNSLDGIIEKYLLGENHHQFKDELSYKLFLQVKPYLDEITPIGLQVHLYSDEYKVQGYLDCIGTIGNDLYMIDFKNSKKFKDEKYLKDYYLQCACYILFLYKMTGVVISNIYLIIANRSSDKPQLVKVKAKDYINEAKSRLNLFKELKENNK